MVCLRLGLGHLGQDIRPGLVSVVELGGPEARLATPAPSTQCQQRARNIGCRLYRLRARTNGIPRCRLFANGNRTSTIQRNQIGPSLQISRRRDAMQFSSV